MTDIHFFYRSVISSEFSEEDLEQWMRSINLSGFDDNISPHNHVDLLLRIVIGEVRKFSNLFLQLREIHFK